MSVKNPVQPSLQQSPPPDLRAWALAFKTEISKEINCVRPGVIIDFNPATATATVMIAQQYIKSVSPTGVQTLSQFSPLVSVPVYTLGGGGVTSTYPIKEGDECIILFSDREIDNWLNNGGITTPTSLRIHDLSDGFCLVGVRSLPRALGNISTTEAQMRTDDGSTFIGINPTTKAVRVHGAVSYEWDVNGYGQKVTWTGGLNWTIDNYTQGATVTTNNHPVNPPGPP